MPSPAAAYSPLVVAHRGASHAHADNSWPAFEAAVTEGADVIECDVQATRDRALAIRHDYAIGARVIEDLDRAEARRADPDLVWAPDLLDWARRAGVGLLLEVKDRRAVDPLADLIVAGDGDQVRIGSFDGPALRRFGEARPSVRRSKLIGSVMDGAEMAWLAARYDCQGVHPCWEARAPRPHRLISRVDVAALQARGLEVTLWHEERPEELTALVDLAADAMCTNTPAALRRMVDQPPQP